MIRIICGGKKHVGWAAEAIAEYEKRLKKPFDVRWEIMDDEKLADYLAKWPFSGREFVMICDERGQNISSPELAKKLSDRFVAGQNVVIVIGGAYGFVPEVRERADFLWSFSKLVFPHMLARTIVMEQVYRVQEIANGGKYHHE